MIIDILSHTPRWVWGLLAGLLVLGLTQTRPRQLTPGRVVLLPLVLLGLGLWSMAPGFMAQPLTALLWLAALSAGSTLLARRPAPDGTTWLAATRRLQLPGSWMPLLLILAVFSLRYAANVAMALNPAWRHAPGLLLPLALLYGGFSGIFLGRALALLKVMRAAAAAPASLDRPASVRPVAWRG